MAKYKPGLVEKKYLLPFVLVTSLFALWGFANDITNPMVAAFQTVLEISNAKAAWIQGAFYGGYFTMAIPAALFIRIYRYKTGSLIGLALYAIGAFLFIPAANSEQFVAFCIALYILTFGLAFLETTANPLILSLGSKETSTRRLNLAQAFNPMGSLIGLQIASQIVLPNLYSDRRDSMGEIIFPTLSVAEKTDIRIHDLAVIRDPYVIIGVVVLVVFLVFLLLKIPNNQSKPEKHAKASATIKRLWENVVYREGVVAQFFYVAAQIMVWTFIIQYANNLGINKATAQGYNVLAMCLFLFARIVSTFLMKYIDSRVLLTVFAIGAAICTLGTILFVGMPGLYCLIAISFFMSLMFPTIYGIALENVNSEDTSLGAAFLIMAIAGGALMPLLQGMIIDLGTVANHPAVNASFVLPLVCFLIIFIYGMRCRRAEC